MRTLSIDIETYSSTDLGESGVYKYVQAPDFDILLLSYAFDNAPVKLVDLAQGEVLPDELVEALFDDAVLKTAYNAPFERTCIAQYLCLNGYSAYKLDPAQWECTQVKAAMVGLPFGLDNVAKVLNFELGKIATGKALIKYFCSPCKPTKVNGRRIRNLPAHDLDKWNEFKRYNVQDVVVEREVRNKIAFFQIPIKEKKLWILDQEINDRGVLLSPNFIDNANSIYNLYCERLVAEAIELTGLDNPNSVEQLKAWICEETGEEVKSLTKETVPILLKNVKSDCVERVLVIRQEMAKTSVKKFVKMPDVYCDDFRARGLFQHYGAGRTGRWAGRLLQPHNLPKNELEDLDLAHSLVVDADGDLLELLFGNIPDTLSQLIRTAFVASDGTRLIVSDFKAIEAKVLAWLANERWRREFFKIDGDIYIASASQMFKVPISNINKKSPLRQRGKVSELALGYQGGPGALIKMGALKMGLVEDELPKLVKMWRNANKSIVAYWKTVNEAAIQAVLENRRVGISNGISFFVERGVLFIELPSGRRLSYLRPKLKPGKFGGHALTYEGMNQTTKKWGVIDTYGGKLVENIVQAIARDCLAEAMLRISDAGYKIVMHIHDEVVLEVPDGFGSTEEVNKIMGETLPWAQGLPLTADSYETKYYRKD